MAKIYGQLEKAQLELLATAPADAPTGYVFYDTSSDQMKIKTPSGFSTVVSKGLPPIGTIVAWVGGYMTGSANQSFTSVFANTVSQVNSVINGDGYYVCDGSELNLASSPIFNGSGRFLPNLTDDRFLIGSTTAGSIGGQNSVILIEANLPSHSHSISLTSGSTGASSSTNVASDFHTHSAGSGTTNMHATFEGDAGTNDLYWRESASNVWSRTSGLNETTTGVRLNPYGAAGNNTSGLEITGNSLGPSSAVPVATTSHLTDHSHEISGNTGPTGSATSYENRPKYLSGFYIMRVI